MGRRRVRTRGGTWWPLVFVAAVLAVIATLIVVSVQLAAARESVVRAFEEPLDPVAAPDAAAAPASASGVAAASGVVADPAWVQRTAAATGIPARALSAYAMAALVVAAEDPACGLAWNTLAGIGAIESGHGSHAGAVLRDDGYPDPAIRGIPLDGTASAVIRDTDGGAWDGDTEWDRAVGPMQFIPTTWEQWGADANGDGRADPNQIDDAALAAGRYLCAGGEMASVDGWRRAILSYNNLQAYVDDVAATADRYADLAGR
jgi:membrane-bound lytic murein transglycosylase B